MNNLDSASLVPGSELAEETSRVEVPQREILCQGQQLSSDYMMAVREGMDTQPYVEVLAGLDRGSLANELNTDAKKLAFWINVYNAVAQGHLRKKGEAPVVLPGRLGRLLADAAPFNTPACVVAGHTLSLNAIEHGLLRRSRLWWSPWMGRKMRPDAFEKRFRVDRLDPRIHFALNCAAESCPPIRFYDAANMEAQLDLAVLAYLETGLRFNAAQQLLELPGIFYLFQSDFGGRKGILQFLNRYRNFTDPANPPRIRFMPFRTAARMHYFAQDVEPLRPESTH